MEEVGSGKTDLYSPAGLNNGYDRTTSPVVTGTRVCLEGGWESQMNKTLNGSTGTGVTEPILNLVL